MCSDVDRTPCTAYFAADGAYAELIWYGRAGLDSESDGAAVAASLELDWHDSDVGGCQERQKGDIQNDHTAWLWSYGSHFAFTS